MTSSHDNLIMVGMDEHKKMKRDIVRLEADFKRAVADFQDVYRDRAMVIRTNELQKQTIRELHWRLQKIEGIPVEKETK